MHQCPICPKSFPSPSKLQRHHFIHTGQKPFTCTECGKAFNQPVHLKTHSRKAHHLSPSADCLRDGVVVNDQQFLPSNHNEPTHLEINRNGAYITPASAMPSYVSSQTEWERKTLPPDISLTSSEIEDQSEAIPHENDGLAIQRSISTDKLLFLDPMPQDEVGFAAVDKSICNAHNGHTCKVCLKSFSSPLQLWIHLPVHENTFGSAIRGQHLSKKNHSKMQPQSHEPSSYRGNINKHQCPSCLKTFCSGSKLKRHFLIHTGQKPFSCVLCGNAYRQEAHLKSHLSRANKCSLLQRDLEPESMHGSTGRRKQSFCNGSQTNDAESQSSLLQHHSSQDPPVNSSVEVELEYKISVSAMQDLGKSETKSVAAIKSEQSFNDNSQQSFCIETSNKSVEHEQHDLRHKDSKPFRCTICNRSFHLAVNLMRHQEIHKGQKAMPSHTPVDETRATVSQSVRTTTYRNTEAKMNSPEPNNGDPLDLPLNIIVKSETWSENYNDSLLQDAELATSPDEQSITPEATSQHQKINTVHQCQACSKRFPSLSKLQRHMMTHTGQRPFACQMCEKRFRQKTHLRVHSRTHLWSRYRKQRSLYISRPPSRITGCNTRLSADVPIQEMAPHCSNLEKRSGVNLLSEKPLDPSPSLSVWNDNNREQPCLLSTSKTNEAMHLSTISKVTVKPMQTPSNLRHRCILCFKCFPSASKLQRHEMVHTGLKPFQCLTCGKTFRQAPHLKVHERTHHKWRPSTPVHQQGKIRKLNIKSQQQLYPRINIHVPPQINAMKKDTAHSKFAHVLSDQEKNQQLPTRSDVSITKVNDLSKTRIENKVACGKTKAHMCRICLKNFATPYKLTRHLITHSGIRPYNCNMCSRTFTQFGHLKNHERSHKHDNKTSDYVQGEMIRSDHHQDKCLDNGPTPETFISAHFIDSKEDVAREQPQSCYTSAGHYLVTDEGLSHCSELTSTEWLALPEVSLLEEHMESQRKQRENCNQVPELYSHVFPSELATEIHRLNQSQEHSALSSSQQQMGENIHSSKEIAFQPSGVMAKSDQEVIGERLVSSVAENQLQVDLADDYWCEPLVVFDCDKCTGSFETEQDLKHHKCKIRDQHKMAESALKHRCDFCLKNFVSPSKLERHYIIHTGQRPFRCDICGKTFTQSGHLRSHQRSH